MPDGPWLAVGLGNPGPQYEGNRHNVGQHVLDHLAAELGGAFKAHSRTRSAVLEGRLPPRGGVPGERLVLAKPGTYMNESGGPISALVQFFGVELDRLLVIHDELDLPFGTVRLKQGGGEGGHNGLRSTTKSLGSPDYRRVRVGIGRPPGRMDPADFVLRDFSPTERKETPFLLSDASDAVLAVIEDGFERAQTAVNTRKE